jgi:nicotinamidase-related amidase
VTDAPTPEPLDPGRSALLVMDYQTGIVGRVQDSDALVDRVASAIAAARGAGLLVGYVRVALTDEDYARVPESNRAFSAAAAARTMHADDPDTQIDARLAPVDGDLEVRKVRVGPFSTTDLDRQLRDRGVDTIVLAGISTSGVVLSTVRYAADVDYRVLVVEDLCADFDPEVHRVLTEKVFPRQADVITLARLLVLLPPN